MTNRSRGERFDDLGRKIDVRKTGQESNGLKEKGKVDEAEG